MFKHVEITFVQYIAASRGATGRNYTRKQLTIEPAAARMQNFNQPFCKVPRVFTDSRSPADKHYA